jgi:hypothetical protein
MRFRREPEPMPQAPLQPDITEYALLRNLQPADAVVLRVNSRCDYEQVMRIGEAARSALQCRVLVVSDNIAVMPMEFPSPPPCSTTSPQHPPHITESVLESLIVHPSHAESMDGSSAS